MFIVKLTYIAPLSEVDKYLKSHREFLEYHYMQGLFLASGPMTPREGGILIALGDDKEGLEKVLQQDPYHMAEITSYEVIEFTPVKYRQELKGLLKQ
jgi:uncharacterized protein YciI